MKKLVFVCVVMGLLAGCATTANYTAALNKWLGKSADSLVSTFGPPDSLYRLDNGGKVLQYSRQDNMYIPGYSYTTPQTTTQNGSATVYGTYGYARGNYSGMSTTYMRHQTAGFSIRRSCVTRFTVNPSGIITRWVIQGNWCRS